MRHLKQQRSDPKHSGESTKKTPVFKNCSTQESDQNTLEILQEENTNLLMDNQRLKSRNSELTSLYEESERTRYDLGEEFESMKKTIDHVRVEMHKDQEANKFLREVGIQSDIRSHVISWWKLKNKRLKNLKS